MKNKFIKDLEKYSKMGYEDLSISKENLIKIFDEHSHLISLNIAGRKVWVHLTEYEQTWIETDISEGEKVYLTI